MKRSLHPLAFLAALGLFTCSLPARAGDADRAAEALFRAGKQAATSGDFDTACRKFQQSLELEPAPGTILNLADCEDHLGRLTLAYEHFERAATLYRPGDARIAYAHQRAAAADKRMGHLVVVVAPGAPPQTTVSRDGFELAPAAIGHALRMDPGEHVVLVRAAGRSDRTYNVHLSEGETKELSVQTGG
ncbi:MAG TPA: hypothetical protein VNO21_03305, partial [Polyangiaceae bacterium]|nr:hypothetical protein [Polyangiaceae bacterium]